MSTETRSVVAFVGRLGTALHLLRTLPMDLPEPAAVVTSTTHTQLPLLTWHLNNTGDALRVMSAMPGNWDCTVDEHNGQPLSVASIDCMGVHVHVVVAGHDLLDDSDAVAQLRADLDAWAGEQ